MATSSVIARARRRPGRPAATRGATAREQLLSAAIVLFAERGVAGTTFSMIAGRTGLTPAMLHYYFADRDQLLDAVVHERMAPIIARVWNPTATSDAPEDLVRGLVGRLLDGIARLPSLPSLWIRDVLSEGGLLRTRVVRHVPMDKVHAFIRAVQGRQQDGRLNRDVDAGLIVFSILGLVMVHSATTAFWADTFQRKRPTRSVLERHISGLVLDGLARRPRINRGR